MSEVKIYEMFECAENRYVPARKVVSVETFDRVTAERDAALGREAALREDLQTRTADLLECGTRRKELQQRLTAADERVDVLEGLLREARQHHGVMLMSDPPQDAWKYHRMNERIDAALKPAEGSGDECAHSEANNIGCPECGEVFK